MSLRSATTLPLLLAIPPALAQNNLYSGNAWDRAVQATQLPPGSGTFDRVELGQFLGDPEPDLLILRGDQLLLARDAATLATYETVTSGVLDFAVLHHPDGDLIAVATTGGVDLYSVVGEGGFASTPLTSVGLTRLREVQLGSSTGIAGWSGNQVCVFDSFGMLVLSLTAPAPVLDAVAGDFLTGQSWDLAVLTKSKLYIYEESGGEAGLELNAVSTDGRLGYAPGSASGLDLLLWLDGALLHNFNETWVPYSFTTAGTDVQAMHAVDYHADPGNLADLVLVDRTGRQGLVLVRNDAEKAGNTGWEFELPTGPNTTFFIPLDEKTAGAALPTVMGDYDLDGDADLIAVGGTTTDAIHVRPGERVDAEAQRIKIHHPILEEELLGKCNFFLGFLALDSSPTGQAFPATATHIEIAIWEDPDESGPDPTPLTVQRHPIGTAAGQIPNQATAGEINFPFSPSAFSYSSVYFVRLRAIREDPSGDQLFPSRIDVFTFGDPDFWTPPPGWQTYPYVNRTGTDPDGTGGLRGGGGGPTPPGSN